MAAFTFTSPDGKSYTVNGPDGATQEQAFAMLQQQLKTAPASTPVAPAQNPTQDAIDQFNAGGAYSSPEEAEGFGKGLLEGGKRAVGGVKQLGADLSDAAKMFWGGVPYVSAPDNQGVTHQLPTSAGSQATAAENARQQAAMQAQPADQQPGFGVGAAFGQAAAQSAIPVAGELGMGATAGRATSFLGNALRQTGLGAATGATTFDPNNQKGADVALGAGLGAGLSILNPVAAFNAVMNRIGRATAATAAPTQEALRAAQPAMEFGQGGNPSPTFAMATGAPTARTMEAASFNGTLQSRYAELSDHFLSQFQEKLGQPGVGVASLNSSFLDAQRQAESTLSALRRGASSDFENGIAQASSRAKIVDGMHGPGSSAVPAQGLRNQLDLIYAEDTDPIGGSGALPKDWMETLRTTLGNGNNQLSVRDTAGVLRRLSNLAQDDDPVRRALANKLRDAFESDLDNIPKGNANDPAVQKLLETRASYKAAQDQIRATEQSAAYRFLGVGPGENVTPESLVSKFSAMDSTKQRQVAEYMRNNSPDLLQLMRRKVVSDAISAARPNLTPASNSTADIGALVDNVFQNGQVRSSGLWNADELKMFQSFRQGARVLSNVGQKVAGGAGTIVGPAEVAPNLISMNPIFAARQIARALQGAKGADLFTDPKLYSIFQRMDRTTDGPTQSALRNAAVQYITSKNGSEQAQN